VTHRLGAAIWIALALAACSGGGGLPYGPVVNSGGGGGKPPTNLVPVKVTVVVPLRASGGTRPDYVSVNTKSLVIELSSVNGSGVTGVNPTTINTVARARGCKAQTGQIVCGATAEGSPGQDVFAVTTYDAAAANGAVLSVGTVQARISARSNIRISNRVPLTLSGVIAAVKVSIAPDRAKRGKPQTSTVSLAAFDASGAQIVGPSDFSAPVELAIQGDASHAFALRLAGKSGSTLSLLRPTSGISLHYDGNVQASSISLAATVSGSGSIGASAPFVLYGKSPPPPLGTIYALNVGTKDGQAAWVTEYKGTSKGNVAPERTLSLDPTLYARTIAVDSKGNLYVGYLDNSLGYNIETGAPDTGNEIAVYAPGASGKAKPTGLLTADPKTQTALFPTFIAFDPSGRLVTFGATTVDSNTGNAVLTYPAASSGPASPQYGFDFTPPMDYAHGIPVGFAIDPANNFYVNVGLYTILGDQYGLYVAPASDIGNPQTVPSRTIPWDSTTELQPGFTTNVGLDRSSEIYIGESTQQGSGSKIACQALVNVYAAGAGGGKTDVKPLRVLTLGSVSARGASCSPSLLAYYPMIDVDQSSLFVADVFNNAIDEFAAGGNGLVTPSLRIVGSATQLSAPIALVVSSISGPAKAGSAKAFDPLNAQEKERPR
jgi:hypothetical protein